MISKSATLKRKAKGVARLAARSVRAHRGNIFRIFSFLLFCLEKMLSTSYSNVSLISYMKMQHKMKKELKAKEPVEENESEEENEWNTEEPSFMET